MVSNLLSEPQRKRKKYGSAGEAVNDLIAQGYDIAHAQSIASQLIAPTLGKEDVSTAGEVEIIPVLDVENLNKARGFKTPTEAYDYFRLQGYDPATVWGILNNAGVANLDKQEELRQQGLLPQKIEQIELPRAYDPLVESPLDESPRVKMWSDQLEAVQRLPAMEQFNWFVGQGLLPQGTEFIDQGNNEWTYQLPSAVKQREDEERARQEILQQRTELEPLVKTVFPDMTLDDVTEMLQNDTEGFVTLIQHKGKTEPVVSLLTQMGLQAEDINNLFPQPSPTEPAFKILAPSPGFKGFNLSPLIEQDAGFQPLAQQLLEMGVIPSQINELYKIRQSKAEPDQKIDQALNTVLATNLLNQQSYRIPEWQLLPAEERAKYEAPKPKITGLRDWFYQYVQKPLYENAPTQFDRQQVEVLATLGGILVPNEIPYSELTPAQKALTIALAGLASVPWTKSTLAIGKEAAAKVGDDALNLALKTGLDKWIATQGRLLPETRTAMGNWLVKDRNWLIERATKNYLVRTAKGEVKDVAENAVKDTMAEVGERLLLTEGKEAVPMSVKVKEALSGTKLDLSKEITPFDWDYLTVPQKEALVAGKGLEKTVALKTTGEITEQEASVLFGKTLPKAEAGQPEAGLQPVEAAPVTPEITIPDITRKGIPIGEGLDQTMARELANGTFQVTPSYNLVNKGFERKIFKTQEEAKAFINELQQAVAIPEAKASMPEVTKEVVTPTAPAVETIAIPKAVPEKVTPVTPEVTAPPFAEPPAQSVTLPPLEPVPVMPTKLGQNVIGLRPIEPGLIRSETINNLVKRILSIPAGKLGISPLVEADPYANAALRERARVQVTIASNANIIGTEAVTQINKVFKLDNKGRVLALAEVISELGAPTIQDIAARLPIYRDHLNAKQLQALQSIQSAVEPYSKLLAEVGVEIPQRADVMAGGFYLPRGRAALEGVDEPVKIGGGRGGMRKGFERPATFESQAAGIAAGYEYAPLGETLRAYAFDAGTRATESHVVNYFKALTDDTGHLLGETPKMRLMRQNPEIAKVIAEINNNLTKLQRNIGALTQRQMDVIDLWQHDPEFGDIDTLLDGLQTMRGGQPPQTLPELRDLYQQNVDALKALRPGYKLAMRKAITTPRDQGVVILPGLQGRTFPNDVANAMNIILRKEGKTIGELAPVVNVVNALNNFYRGMRATLDNSALGIQGLLGLYGDPAAYTSALKVNIQAWGIGGDKILGKFLVEYDLMSKTAGRLTSSDWARAGLHLGGAQSEFQLGGSTGLGEKIANLPGVRQANRAFGYFGDALRLEWADQELFRQLSKRSIEAVRESGDLERIANAANVMTGWARGRAGGSVGDMVLFAPRFLQSRLEVITKMGLGFSPKATLDQRMTRNALLRLIGFGTMLTVGANMILGNDTDFRPIVNGKRNSKFMRIKYGGRYYSLFGTWDSLLGLFINTATGHPLQAIRSMGSGLTSSAFDLITGKDYNFQPTTDTPEHFAQWVMRSMLPFVATELGEGVSQIQEGDVVPGTITIGTQILGVKSFPEEDWRINRRKLGLPMIPDVALYSIENPIYTFDKYASDVLAKLRNKLPEDIIDNKDYPGDVQAIMLSKEYKTEMEKYRSQRLIDYDIEKVNVEQLTQREYALLKRWNEIIDPQRKKLFEAQHPELTTLPRQEWLKANPQENALLALTGDAQLLTKESYTDFKRLIEELDVPDNAVPKQTLLPAESIDTYFQYLDMENKQSWEAQLMLAKDDSLREFLERQPIKTSIAALELKVKNRNLYDELDTFNDKEAKDYIADKEERAEAIEKFWADNPEFRDDTRRVEALEMGTNNEPTPDEIVNGWVERGKTADKFGGGSAEAKLWLLENAEVHQWALQNELLTDAGKDWNEKILRLDVQYRNEDTYFDKTIPELYLNRENADNLIKAAREAYLTRNTDYAEARIRRDLYGLKSPEGQVYIGGQLYPTLLEFPEDQIENYIEFNKIEKPENWQDSWGWYEDDWFLMLNQDFYDTMLRTRKWTAEKDFSKVPSREVFGKWVQYTQTRSNNEKERIRQENPDLEKWGLLAGKFKPLQVRK